MIEILFKACCDNCQYIQVMDYGSAIIGRAMVGCIHMPVCEQYRAESADIQEQPQDVTVKGFQNADG